MKKFSFILIATIVIAFGTLPAEMYAGESVAVETTVEAEKTVETTKKAVNTKKRNTKKETTKKQTKDSKTKKAVSKDTRIKEVKKTENGKKTDEKENKTAKADSTIKKFENKADKNEIKKESKKNNKKKNSKKNKKKNQNDTKKTTKKKAKKNTADIEVKGIEDDTIEVIGLENDTDDIIVKGATVVDVDAGEQAAMIDFDNPQTAPTQKPADTLELNGPPVSMTPIENHDSLNFLNAQELEAFYAYKSSFTDAMMVGGKDSVVYSGEMPDKSYDNINEIINDEIFPYVSPRIYFYYYDGNGDYVTDIVCNPTELLGYYNANLSYKSTVQGWARELVNQSMTESDAFYTILNWLCSRLTYSYGTYEAKYGVESGYGNCMVYSYMLKDMLNAIGIDCRICCGSAEGGPHQWNQVKLDGSWYYTDPCWSDNGHVSSYGLSGGLWDTHILWR